MDEPQIPPGLGPDPEQGLGHGQGEQFSVGQLGGRRCCVAV
jgi:hypothetical protein